MSKYNLHFACEIIPLILQDECGLHRPEYLRMAAEEIRAVADLFDEQAKHIEENKVQEIGPAEAQALMALAKYHIKH